MEPIINELAGSKIELKFSVTPDEAKPYIDAVVEEAGKAKSIPGFRPGKAPYAEIAKAVGGEMGIWQLALEKVVRAWYVKTVLDKGFETIGSPEIAVDQLTPGQDMKFTCTVAVMPKITNAFNIAEPFVEVKSKETKEEEIDKAIEELRKMRRKEVVSLKPAQKEGMVDINLEMKKDNVILEGGTAKNYKVYLSEEHYIPKFADQLIGLNKGDHKTFTLPFPADHFQKMYAGRDIDFDVTVNDVYEIQLPEVNEDFAKELGQESVAKLRELLRANMESEEKRRAMESAEIELLETVVEKSNFTEVPEIMIKEEVRRMYDELAHDIERRGGRMEDYLASIKKTADELRLDLVPQAIKRVKTAVYINNLAKENKLQAEAEEVDNEIDRILAMVQDKETKDRVSSPEYRDYVETMMKNRKTLEFMKEKGIKDYKDIMDKFAKEEAEHQAEHGHVHGPNCNH
ncbi:MAG: trigger factor [Patescibacteria group bacterium]